MKFILTCLLIALQNCKHDLSIWEPKSLRSQYVLKPLKYAIANFGHVPYGHSIYGTVFKAHPENGCSDINHVNWNKNQGNLILFMVRGSCHYAEKVLNAQKAGAGLVIMGDDVDENVETVLPVEKTLKLVDNIKIPMILIGKQDMINFENVLNQQDDKNQIILSVNFALNKQKHSQITTILSIDNYDSYKLVDELLFYQNKIGDKMVLKIHFKVFKNIVRQGNCLTIQNNRYCVNNEYGQMSIDNAKETLKQLCIMKHDFQSLQYYYKNIMSQCFDSYLKSVDNFKDCLVGVYEKYLDKQVQNKVNSCLSNNEEAQELFNENNDSIKYYLINYSPLIFINGSFFKGNHREIENVLDSFCNSFEETPKVCQELPHFQDIHDFNSFSLLKFLFVSTLCVSGGAFLIIGLFYLFYKKKMKKELRDSLDSKINEALEKYYRSDKSDYKGIKNSNQIQNQIQFFQ